MTAVKGVFDNTKILGTALILIYDHILQTIVYKSGNKSGKSTSVSTGCIFDK